MFDETRFGINRLIELGIIKDWAICGGFPLCLIANLPPTDKDIVAQVDPTWFTQRVSLNGEMLGDAVKNVLNGFDGTVSAYSMENGFDSSEYAEFTVVKLLTHNVDLILTLKQVEKHVEEAFDSNISKVLIKPTGVVMGLTDFYQGFERGLEVYGNVKPERLVKLIVRAEALGWPWKAAHMQRVEKEIGWRQAGYMLQKERRKNVW